MTSTDDDLRKFKELVDDVLKRHHFHGAEFLKKCSSCKVSKAGKALVARLEAAEAERDRLTEVMHWAQCVLTAWNVGNLVAESLLHKKLRAVMIEYRERKEAGQ